MFAALALLLASQELAPERYAGYEHVVRSYRTLAAVDARGRRPFRPDAVLARHLVKDASAPLEVGGNVKGESGEAQWKAFTAGEDGRVAEVAWAYAALESESECVALARLEGASMLFVNGAPFAGDPYGYGFGGVPVALRAGRNELFVSGVRGAFRLSLAPCEEGVLFGPWDFTQPTLTVGVASEWLTGVLLLNASLNRVEVTLEALEREGGPVLAEERCTLVPLGLRKLALAPRLARRFDGPGVVTLILRLRQAGRAERTLPLTYAVRTPADVGVRTFRSAIDGSVQKYACLAPLASKVEHPPSLLLSLHGAGVDCEGQAASYAPKQDFWIVAPTNRRPFGFDWQDWGRLDAYEVLAQACATLNVAERVFLAGHSMGGHGTWHMAANDPDRFAALAPSAGWRSFDSYGGRPDGKLARLWRAADAASRTEDLLANLASIPTYVLHGEADDNVPASEGHAMVAALEAASAKPRSHFQPGAGHWWDDDSGAPGTACLDWPGFFELFRGLNSESVEPREFTWISVDPGVDRRHHWVSVDQPLHYGSPLRVTARFEEEPARLLLTTENVRRLELASPRGWDRAISAFILDGQTLAPDFDVVFTRGAEGWTSAPRRANDPREKSSSFCGPLKRAFHYGFELVVPTHGSAAENAASLARARHDAEVWWYRGNGDAPIVTDDEFLARRPAHEFRLGDPPRNALFYGNADTNAAFARIPSEYPLEVRRGRVRLGREEWQGDALGALAVGPLEATLFGVLGSSGPEADRAAAALALFISGVGYPDYVVTGPEVLLEGDGGVRAAGYFDHRWQLAEEAPARER